MRRNLVQMVALIFLLLTFGALAWAGEIRGTVTAQRMKSAENIAIYIDAIPGKTFNPPSKPVVEDQKHMTFVPHVLVVQKGTTVQFLNSDPVGHNVYWPSIRPQQKACSQYGHLAPGSGEVVHL